MTLSAEAGIFTKKAQTVENLPEVEAREHETADLRAESPIFITSFRRFALVWSVFTRSAG
jgi:hypothetical protein